MHGKYSLFGDKGYCDNAMINASFPNVYAINPYTLYAHGCIYLFQN